LVELQLSVEEPPLVTVVGFAVRVAVASGGCEDSLSPPPHAAMASDRIAIVAADRRHFATLAGWPRILARYSYINVPGCRSISLFAAA
jgi:hypothetical protein